MTRICRGPMTLRHLSHHFLILATLSTIACHAQTVMRKATPADANAAAGKVTAPTLPSGAAELKIDRKQIMSLSVIPALTLVPVRFSKNADAAGPPFHQCGLVTVNGTGETHLIVTFGTDWTEAESCVSLSAIGTAESKSKYPALVLIYQATTGHESFPEPVLLKWNAASGIYELDAERSQWITTQQLPYTIPNIRRLLAKNAAESK